MRPKQLLLTGFFFITSLTLGLVVAEVVLRLKNSSMKNYDIEMWRYAKELKVKSDNPSLGHEHAQSKTAKLQSVDFRINSLGLRGPEIDNSTLTSRKILFLGSSITLGWGVKEEETTTYRLQKMLNNEAIVWNAGIGNYNSTRYVNRFLSRLTSLNPTDIVIHYFLRDAEELQTGGGNWFLRNSQLAVTLWTAFNRVFEKHGENTLVEHYKKVYAPDSEGRRQMEKALEVLSQYCAKNSIRLYMAMTPDVHNLNNYPFTFIHEQMRAFAEKQKITFIDLYPALKGLSPEQIWSMPGDPHPNSLGHEKMAEAIYPFFSEKNKTRSISSKQ